MLRGIIIAAILGGAAVWMAARAREGTRPRPVPAAEQVKSLAGASASALADLRRVRGWCVIGRVDGLPDEACRPCLEALVRRRGDVRLRWIAPPAGKAATGDDRRPALELWGEGELLASGVDDVFRRLRR